MSNALYKEKYGIWAGHPHGYAPNFTFCCEEVGRELGRWTTYGQCSRKRGHGPDGAYCKTHDPEVVAKRRKDSESRGNDKYNASRYQFYGKSFYRTLKQIAGGHNDARGLAKEIIEKFHEGELK